jgi:integrase
MTTRKRRAGVEDLWVKTVRDEQGNHKTVPSARQGRGLRYRARYVDDRGCEHSKGFARKAEARRWLHGQITALGTGTHVAPRDAQITVAAWCELWLAGYGTRPSTVNTAKVHIGQIVAEFGDMELMSLRPSLIKSWVAKLQAEGKEPSYVYRLHGKLGQILADAVHDGVLGRNPCSHRTSPPMGGQKPYLATTEQVWALHDAVPGHLRVAVLLGAFAGLRVGEVCGLRVEDVDFTRGIVHPKQQWPSMGPQRWPEEGPCPLAPLKSPEADAAIPIPRNLTLLLSASVADYPSEIGMMLTNGVGTDRCSPKVIMETMREVRTQVPGLPTGFTFHDLRHYFASLLIAKGADIKTVQARLRHASATTTLSAYAHLWPDADESTRTAIDAVIAERLDDSRYAVGTQEIHDSLALLDSTRRADGP